MRGKVVIRAFRDSTEVRRRSTIVLLDFWTFLAPQGGVDLEKLDEQLVEVVSILKEGSIGAKD